MDTTTTTETTTTLTPEPAAPVKPERKVKPLAEQNGEAQAKAITAALKTTFRPIAAAALAFSKGNVSVASSYVVAKVKADVETIGRIIPLLNSPCPAAMFTDEKARQGVTVGALFGSMLGLSAMNRSIVKASLKDAREHLIDIG